MLGSYFFKNYEKTNSDIELAPIFASAHKAYLDGQLEESVTIFASQQAKLVLYPQGCELMISVYAQLPNHQEELASVSRLCITSNKAIGIAHEGLAKSLSELGRVDEAIKELTDQARIHQNERIYGALANLFIFKEDYLQAASWFLKAIDTSEVWSAWLSRALKFESILGTPNFLEQVTEIVLRKEKLVPNIEEKLLDALATRGLLTVKQKLATRLAKEATIGSH